MSRILPGDGSRFDYESLDAGRGLLFIAHLGAGPFSAPGLAGYRVVGTSMRLRFELPPGRPEPSP
ncbi:hypothetical protein [Streptomyces canus]|uniref:hypothetical protein n=1 Tax=Streptomyces canus TaxID=58343 RepID=UPI002E26F7A0